MVSLTINGRKLSAEPGQYILKVARDSGIEIPALCDHESLEPYGACRLCLVEIKHKGRNRPRLVASCAYPVEEGMDVTTDTPRIVENRRMALELLLARCSENKTIREMAAKYGIERPSFRDKYLERNDCILCGLCVRVCNEIVGVSAISLVNRGVTKWAAPPFFEPAPDCIGCGSCFYVCPTGAIKMEEKDGVRKLVNWKREFKLVQCESCGNYWIPDAQVEYMMKKAKLPRDFFNICINCRK
ncbi:MAG: 2Fe-2S iron-sulfur cluster-binding protein [Dehalococcoidia bacterium]|nr:2Fe-2S iron-sulfur cluster-binding protein [Dehalococcoidia bacterium]